MELPELLSYYVIFLFQRREEKATAVFVIPLPTFHPVEHECDDDPSLGLNEDWDKQSPRHLITSLSMTSLNTQSLVLLKLNAEVRRLSKTTPKLESTLVAHSC